MSNIDCVAVAGDQIAILFLHGLGLPLQIDESNARFISKLQSHFTSKGVYPDDLHIKCVNYARLHENIQLKQWSKLNLKWWSNLKTLPSLIPFRYLHLGLSFWGDPSIKTATFDHISHSLSTLSSSLDHSKPIKFVICGFSMGASIAFEFLSHLASLSDHHDLFQLHPLSHSNHQSCNSMHDDIVIDQYTRKLISKLSLIITIGSAISWHFPLRPFTRTPQKMEWLNISYETDVMASPINNQDTSLSHVTDIEIHPFDIDINHENDYDEETILGMVLRVGWYLLCCLIWKPWKFLTVLLDICIKSSPLSHFYYFYDDLVYETVVRSIQSSSAHDSTVLSFSEPSFQQSSTSSLTYPSTLTTSLAFQTTKLSKTIDVALDIEQIYPVTLEKIYEISPITSFENESRDSVTKVAVFIYLHGMSTHSQIESETREIIRQISKFELAYDSIQVYNARYDNLVNKDKSIRFGNSLTHGHDTDEPIEERGDKGRGRRKVRFGELKKVVRGRFPIAMSIWTEPLILQTICTHFAKALTEFASGVEGPTDIVLVGYTIGSIVLLKSIAELQLEKGVMCAGDTFKEVSKGLVCLKGIFTLGCPLSWFGSSPSFPLPSFQISQCLPDYSSSYNIVNDVVCAGEEKEKSKGWINIYFEDDVCSVSLLETNEGKYRGKISKEIRICRHCWTGKIWEYAACWNGLYLTDEKVWSAIESEL